MKAKKLISLFLSAVLLLAVIPLSISVNAASWTIRSTLPKSGSAGWEYYSSPKNTFSTSPYNGGNCTWYAFGRAYEVFGKDPGLRSAGDAGNWYSYAQKHGFSVGSTPKEGSIICWSTHVAFVESVSGSTVTWTESNYQFNATDKITNFKKYSSTNPSTYCSKYGGKLLGYIYLGSTPTPPPSVTYTSIPEGMYYFMMGNNALNLAYGKDENKQNVHLYSYEGYDSQKWEVIKTTDGYKIKCKCCSSRLLNPFADTVVSGKTVNIYDNTNESSQWWKFQAVSGGYIIHNVQNPNVVLMADGSGAYVSTYTGNADQVWVLKEVTHVHTPGPAATCTAPQTCTSCGAQIAPALGHNWKTYWTIDKEATYTSAGSKSHHCERCGAKKDVTAIPKLVADASAMFDDVENNSWYEGAVNFTVEKGLMYGVSATKFDPNGSMTRSMLVAVLYRLEGSPSAHASVPFTDLTQDWYRNAVAWAYEKNIVYGTSETAFSPDMPITREQMVTILFRYSQFKGYDTSSRGNLYGFPDAKDVNSYALDALSWAKGEGLIAGTVKDGITYLEPLGGATRAQVASILMRFCQKH